MGKHFYPEIRPQDRLSFHINDACVATGLSRSTFYNLARAGTELTAAIRKYVVVTAADALTVALWALHTHCFDAFACTPRLAVTAPEKRCGKTTLLDVLAFLVSKALATSNISAAATFRTIEVARPTLLIDEADSFLGKSEDLRGVLNSGHRIGGQVTGQSATISSRASSRRIARLQSHRLASYPTRLRTGALRMRRHPRPMPLAVFPSTRKPLSCLTEWAAGCRQPTALTIRVRGSSYRRNRRAARVTDRLWEVADMVSVVEAWEASNQ